MKYQELCEALSKQNNLKRHYFDLARKFSVMMANSVEEYFEAPRTYKYTNESGEEKTEKTIDVWPADQNWNAVDIKYKNIPQANNFDNNGYFTFYLYFTLEETDCVLNKLKYAFKCGIKPHNDDTCSYFIKVDDENYLAAKSSILNGDNFSEASEYIQNEFIKSFSYNPFSEAIPNTQQPRQD